MDPKAIQQNRDPIGYTKRTRRYPAAKLVATLPSLAASIAQTSNTSLSTEPVDPSWNPEHLAEDILLENLMHVEKHIESIRYVI